LKTAAFCLSLCLLACLPAAAQDRSTPEATVRSFLAAFEHADVKQALACVKGGQLSGASLKDLTESIKKEPVTFTLSDVKTILSGTSATVTAKVSAKAQREEKAQTFDTELNLASSNGSWQIVPNRARAGDENRDLVNALAYALANEKEVLVRARDAARAVSCESNVKQLCVGALLFLQDYDEVFKFKAEAFKKSIMPYVKNEALFTCPADNDRADSYSFNKNLVGIASSRIRKPAETVMIYEGKAGKLNFRHDGKATVGFADGHVKQFDGTGAKALRWMP
jgi:prepilin-type processing-associated H-X9-DG protein